jgi:hypothetical protein
VLKLDRTRHSSANTDHELPQNEVRMFMTMLLERMDSETSTNGSLEQCDCFNVSAKELQKQDK